MQLASRGGDRLFQKLVKPLRWRSGSDFNNDAITQSLHSRVTAPMSHQIHLYKVSIWTRLKTANYSRQSLGFSLSKKNLGFGVSYGYHNNASNVTPQWSVGRVFISIPWAFSL